MANKSTIRLATEHDLNALHHLEMTAFETDRFTRDQIDYLLTRSRATTFVIEQRNEIAGAACVLWRKAKRSARLYNIAVDPAYQGRKFGYKLLRECELEAARRGCSVITLEVREDNEHAIAFYERLGYLSRRIIRDYYHDGSAALKMSKNLRTRVPVKLKHEVPYYSQTLDFTCGPASLMMALKFFRPTIELSRTLELTLWKEATLIFMASGYAGTDGYGLALSALNRGLSCRIIMSMDKTPMLRSVRSADKREAMKIIHNDMKRRARAAGLSSAVHEFGIDEIVSALHRGMIPIVMISTYRLTGDRVPHWVVVTGFDQNDVFIHDPDVQSYRRNRSRARHLRVEKSEFLRMTRYGKEVYRCLILVGKRK